ncbi:MAG TPA: hypothetical protein VN372_10595 [Methanospirillum sp.]|nr:hypothetical protein [Methanospirillum sp.]
MRIIQGYSEKPNFAERLQTRTNTSLLETPFFDTLTDEQAYIILRQIMRENPLIAARAEVLSREIVEYVDYKSVAEGVYTDLDTLDVRDLWSGTNTCSGDTDIAERTGEMIEEALDSWQEELSRYIRRGMVEQALEFCFGILLGIWRFEKESTSEFKDQAINVPRDYFEVIREEWAQKQTDPELVTRLAENLRTEGVEW